MKRMGWAGLTLTCLGMALLPGVLLGQSGPADFDQAYRAQAMEDYEQAVRGYERVIAQHGYSAPVLFNLANACFQQGRIGRAILNYERARLLAPRDPDIQANLRFVRNHAGLSEWPQAWWEKAVGRVSLNGWSWLGSGSLLLLCLATLVRRLVARARGFLLALQVVSGLTMLSAAGAVAIGAERLDRAVVLGKDLCARVSPVPTAKSVFDLAEGEMVGLRQWHGEHVLVRDQKGRVGWVEAAQVSPIVPRLQ